MCIAMSSPTHYTCDYHAISFSDLKISQVFYHKMKHDASVYMTKSQELSNFGLLRNCDAKIQRFWNIQLFFRILNEKS